jgi:hypothetical protein
MPSERHGIVYLAEEVPDEGASSLTPRFRGHWESMDPPRLLETGPGWETAGSAIIWGRARAEVVLIRIGMPGTSYSAGDERPPGEEHLPTWPPNAE